MNINFATLLKAVAEFYANPGDDIKSSCEGCPGRDICPLRAMKNELIGDPETRAQRTEAFQKLVAFINEQGPAFSELLVLDSAVVEDLAEQAIVEEKPEKVMQRLDSILESLDTFVGRMYEQPEAMAASANRSYPFA